MLGDCQLNRHHGFMNARRLAQRVASRFTMSYRSLTSATVMGLISSGLILLEAFVIDQR